MLMKKHLIQIEGIKATFCFFSSKNIRDFVEDLSKKKPDFLVDYKYFEKENIHKTGHLVFKNGKILYSYTTNKPTIKGYNTYKSLKSL